MRGNRALSACGERSVSAKSQVLTKPGEEGTVRAVRTWSSLVTGLLPESSRKGFGRKVRDEGLG